MDLSKLPETYNDGWKFPEGILKGCAFILRIPVGTVAKGTFYLTLTHLKGVPFSVQS